MVGTNFFVTRINPDGNTEQVAFADADGDIVLATGLIKPTDATSGYSKGCIFLDTDATSGSVMFLNEGSKTSANFNPFATEIAAGNLAIAGTLTGTSTSASALTIGAAGATNPVIKIDASTASVATGLSIKGAAAAGGVALATISSGTNESLTVDAKGTGTISLNATGTGNIVLGRATTGVSLAVTAGITSSGPTGTGIGYATGAGGAVTQATNRTTGVTLSKLAGTITTHTASLAAEGTADFIVTNTTVAIGDVVVVSIQSGSNSGGTIVSVSTVAGGSFTVRVHNGNVAAGTAETGAILINFAVIKAVSA